MPVAAKKTPVPHKKKKIVRTLRKAQKKSKLLPAIVVPGLGPQIARPPVLVVEKDKKAPLERPKEFNPRVTFDIPNRGGEFTKPELKFVGQGRLRKIAIIGNSITSAHAPWGDETWEFWSHASARNEFARRNVKPNRYFDLHPRDLWIQEKKWDPEYRKWLAKNEVPIFMQSKFVEAPASRRYPKDIILAEFGTNGFSNHVSWMIALALREGVTHIGIFGCDYTGNVERDLQRPGAAYWAGIAIGRGVQVVVSPKSRLLAPPQGLLYGYESHTKDGLVAAYKAPKKPGPREPRKIQAWLIDQKNVDAPRVALRQDLEEPPAWHRSGHPMPQQQPDGSWKYF